MCLSNTLNIDFLDDLNASIEGLYIAFSKYPTWSLRPGCSCCIDPALAVPLRNKELRELTHEELDRYAWSAIALWGEIDDFRHFLPRLLELCIQPFNLGLDGYAVFTKLHSGWWRGWPADEQSAIENFVNRWWLATLMTVDPPVPVDDVLMAIAEAYDDIEPLLADWRRIESACAFQNFADAFWWLIKRECLSVEQGEQIERWLKDGETRAWLENGYDAYFEEPWAVRLENCILALKGKKF